MIYLSPEPDTIRVIGSQRHDDPCHAKISFWHDIVNTVIEYSGNIPTFASMYLNSYVIRETGVDRDRDSRRYNKLRFSLPIT